MAGGKEELWGVKKVRMGRMIRKEFSIWDEKNVKVLLCPATFIC